MTAPKPLPHTDYPKDRAAIAAGYRHLADLIETGVAPIPMNISIGLNPRTLGKDEATISRELMRALGGGTWAKDPTGSYMVLRGMCAGLPVDLWLDRESVCERVVTSIEEVTETVPAVTEADLRPEQTITRTVEHVEWVCSPLLAAAETTDAIEVPA